MQLDIISFDDLKTNHPSSIQTVKQALLQNGIVGVRGVPDFENKSRIYIEAARKFSALNEAIKNQYAPNRDAGETEGYELGAEWFQTKEGEWKIDDKKASYYAFVPDHIKNKWPQEVDLKSSYLALGKMMFDVGKLVLANLGLDEKTGLKHDDMVAYGRMLHYHKESDATNENLNWCGAHFDHGVFTGLMPAYYFHDGVEVDEPEEAGLYIVPSYGNQFEKINSSEKDVLLFQVGEFGQLVSNDEIKATQHVVRKAYGEIERYTFALFFNPHASMTIQSQSSLIADDRYKLNQVDGKINYEKWADASYDRYRAYKKEHNDG